VPRSNVAREQLADQSFSAARVLFIGLQCLDLLTTLAVLRHGGVELNPLVRVFMSWMSRGMAVLSCKAVLVALVWSFRHRGRVILFGNIFYVGVVIWNLTVLASFK
jgi:hypothetical protein